MVIDFAARLVLLARPSVPAKPKWDGPTVAS